MYMKFWKLELNICFHLSNILNKEMLQRCMTPNPHKNIKYLSQIVECSSVEKKQRQKISYDTFIFADRLTNNKIMVGDAKNNYTKRQNDKKENHSILTHETSLRENKKKLRTLSTKYWQYQENRQMERIRDCLTLLKSTKLFQIERLKDKIFSREEQCKQNEEEDARDIIGKKKKIRQFIDQYLNSIYIKEFRKCMEPSIHKLRVKFINPNIFNFGKTFLNKISKNKIQKIIEEFLQSENQKKKVINNSNTSNFIFPEQQRLKELLIHRMIMKNKDFSFLVSPRDSKNMHFQIHLNSQNKIRSSVQERYQPQLGDHNFNEFVEVDIPKINLKSMKQDRNSQQRIKQLVCAIEKGSTYDILFLIISWPSLLQYRDNFGNNLLHIAAKRNQGEVYHLLIQKMGTDTLTQKNNAGKTPIEVAQLFGSIEIQKIHLEYQKNL